jgi:hypothetical protein
LLQLIVNETIDAVNNRFNCFRVFVFLLSDSGIVHLNAIPSAVILNKLSAAPENRMKILQTWLFGSHLNSFQQLDFGDWNKQDDMHGEGTSACSIADYGYLDWAAMK